MALQGYQSYVSAGTDMAPKMCQDGVSLPWT